MSARGGADGRRQGDDRGLDQTREQLPWRPGPGRGPQPPLALRPVAALGLTVLTVLLATAGRYGYHRDELYFLAAGRRLAWGYPDQPPFAPALARLTSAVAGDSLVALRVPSAVAMAGVVVVTGALCRELGGGRAAQVLAAAAMGVSTLLLAVGHLLSTSTFDLLAWAVITWLVVRALQRDDSRLFLLAGAVAGVGLLNKLLVGFLVAALLLGLLVARPRAALRDRWLWAGAAVAPLLASPTIAWQAANGWPQLEVSRAIAAGGSGTSVSRLLFLPYQLVLVSPVLVPIWAVGLHRLLRDPSLARVRALGWAYLLLAAAFLATGGKPYYLGGMFPVLLASGAVSAVGWAERGRRAVRRGLLAAAVAVSAAVSSVLMLPLLPVSALAGTPVVTVNDDAGETVGWPALVDTVERVAASLPPGQRRTAVVLGSNYGEAGALERFAGSDLPSVHSPHNAFWSWGPPPQRAGSVVAVGYDVPTLTRWFSEVRPAARIDNGFGVDNAEQGRLVAVCSGPRAPWAELWPRMRRVG